jgi:hypothetical protein
MPIDGLLDKLFGRGRWRRVGDGVAVGEVASNGDAWQRRFRWADVKDPAGRELGARLCTKRVNLDFPGTPLEKALALLADLEVCRASVDGAVETRTVRVFAKELRADQALDLITAPIGLEWVVSDGKVLVRPRKEREE